MRIKVITYNIHKGFSFLLRDYTLKAIKQEVYDLGVDLVFLQEVLGQHNKYATSVEQWDPRPQFEVLADQMWQHYCYGKNAAYTEGHHGNAILSHFPIASWQNTNISTNRFEQRGFLYARIQLVSLNKPLHVINTHLDLFERGRRVQIQSLAEFVEKNVNPSDPLIIAGDFNDWTGKVTKILEERCQVVDAHKTLYGNYAKTFPVQLPVMRLDRILIRNLAPISCIALNDPPWIDLSDHSALYAELEL